MRVCSSSLAFLEEASTAHSRGERQREHQQNQTQLATPPPLPHVMPDSLLRIVLGHVALGLLKEPGFTTWLLRFGATFVFLTLARARDGASSCTALCGEGDRASDLKERQVVSRKIKLTRVGTLPTGPRSPHLIRIKRARGRVTTAPRRVQQCPFRAKN